MVQNEGKIGFDYCISRVFLVYAQLLQSCLTLCSPMDCSPPGSSVHEVSQARILERVAISTFRGSSPSKDWICVSCVFCIAGGFFTHWATWGTQSLSLASPNEQKSLTQCHLSWSATCREDVGTLKRIPKSGLGCKVYRLIASLS